MSDTGTLDMRWLTTYHETGTWTPEFAGSGTPGTFGHAANSQKGYYARQGNIVHLFGYLVINAITVAPTGAMSITGLPFAANSATNFRAGVTFDIIDNFNYTAAAIELTGVIVASGTSILLFESFDNAPTVQVPAANFNNAACDLQFHGTYLI